VWVVQVRFERGTVATPELLQDIEMPSSVSVLGQPIDLTPLKVTPAKHTGLHSMPHLPTCHPFAHTICLHTICLLSTSCLMRAWTTFVCMQALCLMGRLHTTSERSLVALA
jgi:hypothetical protein